MKKKQISKSAIRSTDRADARLHVGTVVANEDNECAFRPTHFGQRISSAVDAFESKVTCLPTKVTNIGRMYYHQASSINAR